MTIKSNKVLPKPIKIPQPHKTNNLLTGKNTTGNLLTKPNTTKKGTK